MVEDSTKRLTPFSRDKLFITVYESCKHRPDAVLDAGGIVQTIIKHIIDNQKDGVVQRRDIVLAALKVLGRFDQTAAAVYAAYHPV
jgi:transcriptional regulator NrdR family protein